MMSLDFQPCTNNLDRGGWPDLISLCRKWFFSQTGLSLFPRYIPGCAATEQLHVFPWVCTDAAFDCSPEYSSPSFPLFTFQTVLFAFCECGVTPPVFRCFVCGRVHCMSVSLNTPVSRNVEALGVLTPVKIDSVSLKRLKQTTKYNKKLLVV